MSATSVSLWKNKEKEDRRSAAKTGARWGKRTGRLLGARFKINPKITDPASSTLGMLGGIAVEELADGPSDDIMDANLLYAKSKLTKEIAALKKTMNK